MKTSPKILMVDSLVGNDYSIFLCDELNRQGVDVSLVMTEDRKITLNSTVNVIRLMPSKQASRSKIKKALDLPIYFFRILKLILKDNYNIIHYQFFRIKSIESFFYLLLKLFKVKLVHTAHEVLESRNGNGEVFFDRIIYRCSDALVVHSQKNKNDLSRLYNIDEQKIFVAPHGSFDFYEDSAEANTESARKELGISLTKKVLLFFGFIKEYKGLDVLLDCLQKYKGKDFVLLIVGSIETKGLENKLLESIDKVSANVKIISKFEFIDQSKIPTYFLAADAVVLPYKKITHSGVLHLAYSFAKPVIVTRVGDFEESVESYKSGILVNPDNSRELHDAIKTMLSDELDLKFMGMYAKRLNDEKFSWELSAKKLNKVYESLNQ